MASIVWDLIRPADMVSTEEGLRLTRGLLVRDISISTGGTGTDPRVLLNCLSVSGFPAISEEFAGDLTWLTVKERRVREIVSKTAVKWDIVYGGAEPVSGEIEPTWVVQDGYTTSVIQTMSTANDSKIITVWYNRAATFLGKPGAPTEDPIQVRKYQSRRHVRCIARMTKSQWDARKDDYRGAVDHINDDDWSEGTRGTWLFHGPQVTTTNTGAMVTAQLDFTYDPKGHFAVGAWFNSEGRHPKDCITEADLRGAGLPAVGDIAQGKGLTIASVQLEADFDSVFPFTLD
jgi:hypothetical protein